MRFVIDGLPWPPHALNPNARVHHMMKARIAKQYRGHCHLLARQALNSSSYQAMTFAEAAKDDFLHLWIDFFPPDRRARDDDNLIAAFKNGRDGIADALGIDDRRFRTHAFVHSDKPSKRRYVRVTITSGPLESLNDHWPEV